MVNTIALQTLEDGPRKAVVKINITGDASGDESTALVVDVSTLSGKPRQSAPSEVRIMVVTANLGSFDAQLNWDASTDLMACAIASGSTVSDFRPVGGLVNNAGTGKTGDILLSTTGLGSEKGTIVLELKKEY